jgi:hypothetical protein
VGGDSDSGGGSDGSQSPYRILDEDDEAMDDDACMRQTAPTTIERKASAPAATHMRPSSANVVGGHHIMQPSPAMSLNIGLSGFDTPTLVTGKRDVLLSTSQPHAPTVGTPTLITPTPRSPTG